MNKVKFLVQGSEIEPYQVSFVKSGNNLSAYCTCPAGEHGIYCKHRIRILTGGTEGIVSSNLDDVKIIQSWLPGTDVEESLNSVADAEAKFDEAKKNLSNAKKKLARVMFD